MSERYLIVGLGNPGREYETTRHNVGWMVLDELARRYALAFDKKERKAAVADGILGDKRVLLAKPQTYMNRSGEAVRALVDFYKIDLDRILIIADDLDLPLGTIRLRQSGGSGGQKGVKSIIQHLGTQDFNRLRFGIGRPPGKMDPVGYVLQPFTGDDDILARETIDRAAAAVESWLVEGIEAAMSRHNGDGTEGQITPQPDPEDELALYLRAHELAPNDPKPLEKMVGVLKRLGRLDEAARRKEQIAELYLRQGNRSAATANWEQAASLDPDRIELHIRIAESYEQMGNGKKAVNRYLILANHLEQKRQTAEAIKAVDEALRVNPQHPKAMTMAQAFKEKLIE